MGGRGKQALWLAGLTGLSLLGVVYAGTMVYLVVGLQMHCGGCLSFPQWLWLNFYAVFFWAGLVLPAAAWIAFALKRPRIAWALGLAPLLVLPAGAALAAYTNWIAV